MIADLRECIEKLLECDAFELQLHTDENGQMDCYLPYMLNDALEYYFVLKDCRMTGDFIPGNVVSVDFTETDTFPALILRHANGTVATLWFKNVQRKLNCYRYHEIGHFWVAGQEQWRQLVYIIGTIYDKFEYQGISVCNDTELALLPLMEFAPFRYWSPIHDSLDRHYADTWDGAACFRELCIEAEDKKLLRMLWMFEKFGGRRFISRRLAKELAKAGHEKLYELIYKKVCEASLQYPARDYGEVMNQKISAERENVAAQLLDAGFSGDYPRFRKGNCSVLVTEEHPFTLSVLEYENYGFRLQMMVSECSSEICYLNQGFFEGNGNRGWIAKTVGEIDC